MASGGVRDTLADPNTDGHSDPDTDPCCHSHADDYADPDCSTNRDPGSTEPIVDSFACRLIKSVDQTSCRHLNV